MVVEVKVPVLGESVTEATVAKWLKDAGSAVAVDEALVELETDKVTLEVNAPVAGALSSIVAPEGSDVNVGALLCMIEEGAAGTQAPAEAKPAAAEAPAPTPAPTPAPAPAPAAAPTPAAAVAPTEAPPVVIGSHVRLSPSVRKLVTEHNLDPAVIPATGPGGRIMKGDIHRFLQGGTPTTPTKITVAAASDDLPPRPIDPREEVVPMSKLRRVISKRLKDAQNSAAMLTTWNEVDMQAAMDLRTEYKDSFEKKHGVRLGFMSIFVRACVNALKEWPAVNAEIYGTDQIYKNYYNIGVAVGSPNGLVVPVLKDADEMSFVDTESKIADFGRRARDGKLSIDEMGGGTFTISNGGVFGSLMSMPILNTPQSAILGMHKIQKRPMVVGDSIEIRPMMYLALSYDHRIVDGREAVSFLVRIKECIEDPQRILIDV
ncbi:MAG: 2-oxoglutarate dehydrogenase complex dihydrolipoyllysine-residue succinyltransferase [Rhodospirillales bacterium]|jgi:2-oxoglutarate dehydrogenase E2 component (dihydrolipoamide succinyltransferase)|nr:2-oxoglutarate dehydrogenase complex dihydrolipoyllysine-residue succinyltransferase [Rhodospirillales bacterium]